MTASTIFNKHGMPADLITKGLPGSQRLKVNSAPRVETTSISGRTTVGLSYRVAVSAGTTYDTVVTTGSKWLVIENIQVNIDFTNITNGNFKHQLDAAVEGSNGNTWSYIPSGTPVPLGRPVNAHFINDFNESRGEFDQAVTFTGAFDYPFFYEDYYLETQGNSAAVTSSESAFFDIGKILIPPFSKVLVRALSTGNASGTADIRTVFFVTEVTNEEIGIEVL